MNQQNVGKSVFNVVKWLSGITIILFFADVFLPVVEYIPSWPWIKIYVFVSWVIFAICMCFIGWFYLLRKKNLLADTGGSLEKVNEDKNNEEEFFIADDLELCLEGNLACIQDKDAIISFMKETKSFQFQPDQGFYFFDHDTTYQKKVEIKDYLEAMLELTSGNWESVLIAHVPPFQHEGKFYSVQNGEMVFSAKGCKTCNHVLLYPDW